MNEVTLKLTVQQAEALKRLVNIQSPASIASTLTGVAGGYAARAMSEEGAKNEANEMWMMLFTMPGKIDRAVGEAQKTIQALHRAERVLEEAQEILKGMPEGDWDMIRRQEEKESYDQLQARMKKAFDAVADPHDWRKEINKYLPQNEIDKAGGIETIREAIIHFTATVPVITQWEQGFYFKAVGYRKGPAGP